MADDYRFRTAVGGFHKGDVSAYIAAIASKHKAELSKLEQALTAAEQENAQLRQQLAAAEAAQLEVPTVEAEALPCTSEHITELELDAYRRAEAAERLAYQRAKRLYEDMQDICSDSTTRLHDVSAASQEAIDTIHNAIHKLTDSLESTQNTAKQAAEFLDAMGALVPDPAEGLEAVP